MTRPHQAALPGRHILVIEDDFLVGQVICEMLEEEGATVLGPIGWLEEARAFIEDHVGDFDSVLLDINLHGQKSYALAEVLTERGVGFVFMTGYSGHTLEGPYRSFPRCEKPVRRSTLLAAITAASAGAASEKVKT
ncbi:MAG: response regulator [Acetobacteraceae bacterium]|nr:response regulator [Acetobacteraceae bacterium]